MEIVPASFGLVASTLTVKNSRRSMLRRSCRIVSPLLLSHLAVSRVACAVPLVHGLELAPLAVPRGPGYTSHPAPSVTEVFAAPLIAETHCARWRRRAASAAPGGRPPGDIPRGYPRRRA